MSVARQAAIQAIDASIQVARARFEEGDMLKQELLNLEVQQSLASEDLIQARQAGLRQARGGILPHGRCLWFLPGGQWI